MRSVSGIPYVDETDLDAWGKCDKTGLPCMYRDLRPQMEYRGNTLVWTGLMVNEKDLDEPNPQLMPAPMRPDPVPVKNPKPFFRPQSPDVPADLTLIDKTALTITVDWSPVDNAEAYAVSWTLPNSGNIQSTLEQDEPGALKATNYQITGLSPRTAYIIRVLSINDIQLVEDGHPLYTFNTSAWSSGNGSLYVTTF